MRAYILKRAAIAVLTLLLIVLILFVLMTFLPGSPFNDERLSPEQIATLRARYGLDQPILVQFWNFMKNTFSGDFGVSYAIQKNVPISSFLSSRLPVSMRIGGQAILLGTFLGLILGIVAALKHNTIWDTLCTVLSVVGVSIPSYVFALGLSYLFGFKLKWFPILYQDALPFQSSVLATVALSLFTMASIARFTRTELLEVLSSDYILFAQSRGIDGFRLIARHALRNALIPVVTVLAPLVVGLMTGSLVVERIFSVPGVGQLLVEGIQANDYSVVTALSFVYSLLYIAIMLVVDILYGVIDPRIRLAKGASQS
ncbi:MAG: ABC transporter permease [Christensenellaceae bacterium]|jgi:oligopeptide transport system permease protein|nr:ABC transporter permease [Christensenellaceae bacterium]